VVILSVYLRVLVVVVVSCHAIKENGSWDGDAAKKSLFEWATDPETGELQPKKLKP